MKKPEAEPTTSPLPKPKRRSIRRRILQWSWRVPTVGVLSYAVLILVGLIPVNNDFEPSPDGVEIYLVSTAIHADIVLPVNTDVMDWRKKFRPEDFAGEVNECEYVAVGWGDRGFFIDTPTWNDLSLSTAAYALFWPSETCMHVTMHTANTIPNDAKTVKISQTQYEKLTSFINDSFRTDDQKKYITIPNASYSADDAFYSAQGNYHCLYTCNCWVGDALKSAGVRTGWYTPLPKTTFLYLP